MLVLTTAEYIRNYLRSGAVDSLADATDLYIVATDALRAWDAELRAFVAERPGTTFVGYLDAEPVLDARHYFLLDILMWRHRDRSKAFRFRSQRVLGKQQLRDLRRARTLRDAAHAMRALLGRYRSNPKLALFPLLAGDPLFSLVVRPYVRRRLPERPSIERALGPIEPDLVLFPSSAHDPVGMDLCRFGGRHDIPVAFLIDNWDNLSSKSILWAQPDHLAVWGPQSRDHARTIHGIDGTRVTTVGTARFDAYERALVAPVESPFPYRYVLFLGCALPFDEVSVLRRLDAAIGDDDGLRIVYRPHPWRQPRTIEEPFDERTFAHVVLDPQLAGYADPGTTMLPELDYYGPLLKHAHFVVAPLTTMVIESVIFRKRVLVIAFDDGVHVTSPVHALANYPHFEGIETMELITICHDPEMLTEQFHHLDALAASPPADSVDEQLRPFLHRDDRPYGERLRALAVSLASAGSRVDAGEKR